MSDKTVKTAPSGDLPQYAYHFTNFEDFLKIVKSGRLYSRSLAEYHGAVFSHNTSLSDKVMADTDDEIKNYARLALSPVNSAFHYFKTKHGKNFAGVEMRFALDNIHTLPRLRISEGGDRPASKLKFTRELPRLLYADFLEKLDALAGQKMAEILVYGEVPLFCLAEAVIEYSDAAPRLGDAENILNDNGTIITMRQK